ncbi:plastin-3-like isoform X1 [Hydractinia symbiolongicarpus]|uniref:plastin-3-like isoform X1 n=1 Tax=Hydractinia symbiolongicarpus TaxID=13093 RepID=UPI00254D860B|nr:plastin-3-like isoform X1 [Hydractinia symbiolongicarpus]
MSYKNSNLQGGYRLKNGNTLKEDIVNECRNAFHQFDADGNGHITSKELGAVFNALNENVPGYKLREMIEEVDKDKNGTIEFDEFLEMYCKVTSKGVFGQWTSLVSKRAGIKVQGGSTEASADGTTHTSSDAEQIAFKDWINSQLNKDPDCQQYLPIGEGDDLFEKMKDGILFCKMINLSAPKTIDERAVNKGRLNAFLIQENNILVTNSAQAIGCTVVNIAAEDISRGKHHLMLGLLWQIIRIGLFANITLTANPNIAALLEEGETIEDLMKLTPEELLLRWVNYHLRKSGSMKRINNFSGDIKDSEAYAILLNQISPQEFGVDRPERVMSVGDHTKRAELILKNADKINCKKFLTPREICNGNAKLNLAFVANLFNHFPALDDADIEDVEIEDYEESREEKTFRNWMNSLGVNPFVYHLYHDLNNGMVLFQLFEDIKKGTVNFDKVNKPPFKLATGGNMKKIENCNYAVELGKSNNYSLVGIGGEDIYNGTHTLTLALVWQMLRHYTMNLLGNLTDKDGATIKDVEIVDWVNKKLQEAHKKTNIKSFKDSTIASSLAVIDLIDAIKPGSIDYSLVVNPALEDEDKELNAQYAISMSRKIGARTYALPEDLVEVKPKMVLTVFACLMTRAMSK